METLEEVVWEFLRLREEEAYFRGMAAAESDYERLMRFIERVNRSVEDQKVVIERMKEFL